MVISIPNEPYKELEVMTCHIVDQDTYSQDIVTLTIYKQNDTITFLGI